MNTRVEWCWHVPGAGQAFGPFPSSQDATDDARGTPWYTGCPRTVVVDTIEWHDAQEVREGALEFLHDTVTMGCKDSYVELDRSYFADPDADVAEFRVWVDSLGLVGSPRWWTVNDGEDAMEVAL